MSRLFEPGEEPAPLGGADGVGVQEKDLGGDPSQELVPPPLVVPDRDPERRVVVVGHGRGRGLVSRPPRLDPGPVERPVLVVEGHREVLLPALLEIGPHRRDLLRSVPLAEVGEPEVAQPLTVGVEESLYFPAGPLHVFAVLLDGGLAVAGVGVGVVPQLVAGRQPLLQESRPVWSRTFLQVTRPTAWMPWRCRWPRSPLVISWRSSGVPPPTTGRSSTVTSTGRRGVSSAGTSSGVARSRESRRSGTFTRTPFGPPASCGGGGERGRAGPRPPPR